MIPEARGERKVAERNLTMRSKQSVSHAHRGNRRRDIVHADDVRSTQDGRNHHGGVTHQQCGAGARTLRRLPRDAFAMGQ